jgi:hypothetical protein
MLQYWPVCLLLPIPYGSLARLDGAAEAEAAGRHAAQCGAIASDSELWVMCVVPFAPTQLLG